MMIFFLIIFSSSSNCGTGTLIIPENTTQIEDEEYFNCSSYTGQLIIPDSVSSIGSRSFYCCLCFESIKLSNSLQSIGDEAFSQCFGFY